MGNRVRNLIQKQFQKNFKAYNRLSKEVSYVVGHEVFRGNFKQSNFAQGYNSKLDPNFLKGRRKFGNSTYELEDLRGNLVGVYQGYTTIVL